MAVSREEAALHLRQLHQAKLFESCLKRQILPEGNKMNLVIDRKHGAVVIDRIDGIVCAGTAAGSCVGISCGAGHKRRALRQEVCNLSKRIRLSREEKRKS